MADDRNGEVPIALGVNYAGEGCFVAPDSLERLHMFKHLAQLPTA